MILVLHSLRLKLFGHLQSRIGSGNVNLQIFGRKPSTLRKQEILDINKYIYIYILYTPSRIQTRNLIFEVYKALH